MICVNSEKTVEIIKEMIPSIREEWLEKNNMSQFVSKVTSEKPRARAYIDDKAVKFTDWASCLSNFGGES
jgi:hypothetical protein